jgi:hypothetical protein
MLSKLFQRVAQNNAAPGGINTGAQVFEEAQRHCFTGIICDKLMMQNKKNSRCIILSLIFGCGPCLG